MSIFSARVFGSFCSVPLRLLPIQLCFEYRFISTLIFLHFLSMI